MNETGICAAMMNSFLYFFRVSGPAMQNAFAEEHELFVINRSFKKDKKGKKDINHVELFG